MSETLTFHFEGALADSHRMNFYESARFQYAAARLLVKLAQFRTQGKFVKNITNNSNFDVELVSQSDGSFNINVEDSGQLATEERFIEISLADLLAYVSERVIEKIEQSILAEATVGGGGGDSVGGGASAEQEEIDRLIDAEMSGRPLTAGLPPHVRDLVKRRAAEFYREQRLQANRGAVSRIDFARSQRLVAMSAPLISEMATALRRSADTLQITSSRDGGSGPVLFLNREMAQQIETASVDDDITPILGDVIQFNKDNGWGKLKIENGALILSFSVPSDILQTIRQKIIGSMNRDMVYLQAYFVRDRSNKIVRLIIVGVLPLPEA